MNEDSFHLGIKAIIKNSVGDLLLLKVNTEKLKNYKDEPYWDIPGGRIEKGSTIEETLKREVREETGIKNIESYNHIATTLSNNIRILTNNEDVGLILSAYLCNVTKVDQIHISDEHTEARWFSPRESAELLQVKYPQEFIDIISKL